MILPKTAKARKSLGILFELLGYGFIIRLGQLLSILLALQFGEIFQNPAQIIFLFPVAIVVIIVLGILTLAEIECNRYIEKLEKRLDAISFFLDKETAIAEQGFLQKPFLPAVLNFMALPLLLIFLGWTSLYLTGVLLISVLVSGLIIFNFSKSTSLEGESDIGSNHEQGKTSASHQVPIYLIADIVGQGFKSRGKKLSSTNDDRQSDSKVNALKKRKLLMLVRQTTRVLILVLAVVLVAFNITSLAKAAGFLLVGNFFRSGCISIFEFMTSTANRFPLDLSLNTIELALIEADTIEQLLIEKQERDKSRVRDFNERYSSLINNHPYMRFKDVSIRENTGKALLASVTGRLHLKTFTIIKIESNFLANKSKRIIGKMREIISSTTSPYLITGEVFLGKKRISASFLDSFVISNPNSQAVFTADIFDYFDDGLRGQLKEFLIKYPDLSLLLESIATKNISIESLSQREVNQFKSIIQLTKLALSKPSLSLSLFSLDCFEPADATTILQAFGHHLQNNGSRVILLTRSQLPKHDSATYHKLTPDGLARY